MSGASRVLWTRRELLKLSLASVLLSGCSRFSRREQVSAPRYFMTIFMRGGIDAIWTTNPRTRSEVASGIDVPYGANEIVDAKGIPLGPLFAPLAARVSTMAILNGVQVQTANHETGAVQMARVRTGCTQRHPALLDIIGRRRDGQPLASVALGPLQNHDYAPNWFPSPQNHDHPERKTLFERLDDTTPEDLQLMAEALRSQLKRFGALQMGDGIDATAENLRATAELFERLAGVPRFAPNVWSTSKEGQSLATTFQRALWVLQNDLARCVYLKIHLDWDSHFDNQRRQTNSTSTFITVLDRFLAELATTRNHHGTLASNTLIFAGSELGRLPILNGDRGKDHFPEAPYLFLGPGINTHDGKGSVFGATNGRMQATSISLTTGRASDAGHLVTLDDVGTTLLTLAGLDPEQHGYQGRRLDFLLSG